MSKKSSLKEQTAMTAAAIIRAVSYPAKPISLGLDLDGVIDENAAFFAVLTDAWPGDVFIITYRDDKARAILDLAGFGVVKYTDVVLVNSFAEKADVIARLAIDVYIDDQDEVLMHIPSNVTILKMRNGGNYDAEERKWLYSDKTGRQI